MSGKAALSIRRIVKTYGPVQALRGVSLDVESGGLVCFLGPSGCGKTTLLRVIAGLEEADSGEVLMGGRDLSHTPARERNFGVVFQSYSLFPNRTAARNVAYGLECRKMPKPQQEARIAEMLALVQLADQAGKLPTQMSGGQQQRVALARALAINPAVLLLDEPLSALDAKVREELRGQIREVQQRLGITTIMVTHDQEEALAIADRIVVMSQGAIEQIGSPRELYEAPATPFVAGFIGLMNLLPVAKRGDGAYDFAGRAFEARAHQGAGRLAAIRPEAIGLGGSGPNHLFGKVAQATFLGNLTRIVVLPDGAPAHPLMVELRSGVAVPEIGAEVSLHLPATALSVLA